jgi:hypothetical protein
MKINFIDKVIIFSLLFCLGVKSIVVFLVVLLLIRFINKKGVK